MKIQPEWIEWKGGECPVDEKSYVVCELRGGHRSITEAWRYSWRHYGNSSDIIAYAPVDIDIEPYKLKPKWVIRGDSYAQYFWVVYEGRAFSILIESKSAATAIADALNAAGVEL